MADEQVSVPWTEIEGSTQVAAYAYEPGSLYIRYQKGGAEYRYKDVGPGLFAEFLTATSKGKFLASEVKGKYEFERIG